MADTKLSGAERAAMLVSALDDERASMVLKGMSQESLKALRQAVDNLDPGRISRRDKLYAVASFLHDQRETPFLLGNPHARFRHILDKVVGEEVDGQQLQNGGRGSADEESGRGEKSNAADGLEETIRAAASGDLANLLNQESVRCAAVLLNAVSGELAGELLNLLEPDRRELIAQRLCTMDQVPEKIEREVTESFRERLRESQTGAGSSTSEGERMDRLADMISGLEGASQKRILEKMQQRDPELAEQIERRIFAFEDLVNVEAKSLQKLLSKIEISTLAIAIKGAPEEVEKKISANLSQRMLEQVNEERELAGSVPVSEAMEARDEIMRVAREMDREGNLDFAAGSTEEEFVE